MSNHPKTHRCKDSLEAGISIRFQLRYSFLSNEEPAWQLYQIHTDGQWDSKYPLWVATISRCPFCGKKLKAKSKQEEYVSY